MTVHAETKVRKEAHMRKLVKKGNMNERIDIVLHKFRSRMTSYPPGMCPLRRASYFYRRKDRGCDKSQEAEKRGTGAKGMTYRIRITNCPWPC